MLDSKSTFYQAARGDDLSADVPTVISSFLRAEQELRQAHEQQGFVTKDNKNSTQQSSGDGAGAKQPSLTDRLNHAIKSHMRSMSRFNVVVERLASNSSFQGLNAREDIDSSPFFRLLEMPPSFGGPRDDDRYRLWVQEQLEDEKTRNLGFEDVGSGLSYCLPVLMSVQLEGASLIQQPELHLHPAAQCELGDIFLSALSSGRPSVVETHSEHLILRVLRRIREHTEGYLLRPDLKVKAEDVLVLYFEPVGDETRVHRIRVDQYGEFLDPWPRGFFSERELELFPEGLSS
jgi:hypothetical protein